MASTGTTWCWPRWAGWTSAAGSFSIVRGEVPVDAAARALLADRSYADRVSVVAGDMFGELPHDHDLHLLSHTLHDWDEEAVRRILGVSFAALSPGGWLVDHDDHINADKAGPLPIARYSVLLATRLGVSAGPRPSWRSSSARRASPM